MTSANSHRIATNATRAPVNSARMNHGASTGRMPENVSVRLRATATAGLAKLVEAVNQ
jgi:hypothetical protein